MVAMVAMVVVQVEKTTSHSMYPILPV